MGRNSLSFIFINLLNAANIRTILKTIIKTASIRGILAEFIEVAPNASYWAMEKVDAK